MSRGRGLEPARWVRGRDDFRRRLSAALPVISGVECVRALQRLGYIETRRKGSHIRLNCPGRPPVTVPDHETLDRGTPRSIIRATRLTVDEFLALLSR